MAAESEAKGEIDTTCRWWGCRHELTGGRATRVTGLETGGEIPHTGNDNNEGNVTSKWQTLQGHGRKMSKRLNTLWPKQNGRYSPDDVFKCISLNENNWILIKISQKSVPEGPISNSPALVQLMAWRRSGDKPLSEPMIASLLTHICVTRTQWVNRILCYYGK